MLVDMASKGYEYKMNNMLLVLLDNWNKVTYVGYLMTYL